MTKKTTSIRDVAKYVGVSPGTVSRVLNNRMGNVKVADATRQLILEGAAALNYSPNINARRLFSHKSNVIALILPSYQALGEHIFCNLHLRAFFSGLEDAINTSNYNILLCFNDRKFVENKKYLQLFREGAVDGIIIWGACPADTFWYEIDRKSCPLLFVGGMIDAQQQFNLLLNDYAGAARAAAELLYGKGHRRFLFLGGTPNSYPTLGMLQGIKSFAAACPDVVFFDEHGDYLREEGTRAMDRALCDRTFSAVIAANMNTAKGALASIAAHHLHVPGDVAVIACDCADGEEAETTIASVVFDDYRQGMRSVELMSEIIDRPRQIRELTSFRIVEGMTI